MSEQLLIDMQESKMPRLTSRNPIKMLKLARTTSKRKPAIKQLNPAEIKPRITSSIRHRFQRYGQLDRSYRQSHGNQNKSYERGPALAVNPSGWKVSQLVTVTMMSQSMKVIRMMTTRMLMLMMPIMMTTVMGEMLALLKIVIRIMELNFLIIKACK